MNRLCILLKPYDRHSLESCSAVSCTGSCIAALATALYCSAVAKRSREAGGEIKNLSICNYDGCLTTSIVIMNSANSTNVGSTVTLHSTDTPAKHDHDIKGGSNSKDSDSEGEGAEEVCLKKVLKITN